MTQTQADKTKQLIDSLLEYIPMNDINELAEAYKADGHAQILKVRILVTSVLFAMITCRRLSQRGIMDCLSSPEYKDFAGIEEVQEVTHQAICKRLRNIPVELSKAIFQKAYDNMKFLFDNDFFGFNLVRIDTTTVSEVCAKLSEGMVTGQKPSNPEKERKKSLKYTMASSQWEPVMARILTDQKYLSDDLGLMEVIAPMAEADPDHLNLYAIDRGMTSTDNIDVLGKDEIHFVLRLKKGRLYAVEEELPLMPPKDDDSVQVISDQKVRLKTNPKYVFRLVIYKPLDRKGTESEENEAIWVLTDELKLTAQQIAMAYKKRWDIEVLIKYLKQNLFLSHFTSVSSNGLAFMLYMTMLAGVLVGRVCQTEKVKYTAALFLIAQALYQKGKELAASLTKAEFLKKLYSMDITLSEEQKQELEAWDPNSPVSKGCH